MTPTAPTPQAFVALLLVAWQRVPLRASFGLVLALTQHEVADLDGRVRSAFTMAVVGVLAMATALTGGGRQAPDAPAGWRGLLALSVLYGTAFTAVDGCADRRRRGDGARAAREVSAAR